MIWKLAKALEEAKTPEVKSEAKTVESEEVAEVKPTTTRKRKKTTEETSE